MSELSEAYKEWSKNKKEKKEKNKNNSIQILEDHGVNFLKKNYDLHIIIKTEKGKINFYPSTGRYIIPGNIKRRGVFNLIKYLQQEGLCQESSVKEVKEIDYP